MWCLLHMMSSHLLLLITLLTTKSLLLTMLLETSLLLVPLLLVSLLKLLLVTLLLVTLLLHHRLLLHVHPLLLISSLISLLHCLLLISSLVDLLLHHLHLNSQSYRSNISFTMLERDVKCTGFNLKPAHSYLIIIGNIFVKDPYLTLLFSLKLVKIHPCILPLRAFSSRLMSLCSQILSTNLNDTIWVHASKCFCVAF